MRIQVMSDLHLELHADGGAALVEALDPTGVDVLVLAGDVAVGEELPAALGRLCRRYPAAEIVYVHGNHEHYGQSPRATERRTREVERRHPNLHWLERRAVTLGGQRFLGATLWFPHDAAADPRRGDMSDFTEIRGFEPWVYEVNASTVGWLREQVQAGDVVVTHHLPTPRAIAPEYRGHALNPFFVCDLDALILAARPALWCFGHTHRSFEALVGETLLVANPFGYLGTAQNERFVARLLVEP
ncbi:MAG TPA: metallophosphoesterase [Polyangiaceae bacterium]|nr:metallophosphoesterase [Polyangiaceae bacterium]